MRATHHNGRGKQANPKGFSDCHNDRNFDYQNADHINPDRTGDNLYWNCYSNEFISHRSREQAQGANAWTFSQVEHRYYSDRFGEQYNEQMTRYAKKGQHSYIKDFDEWRQSKRYCPEETFFQVGKIDDHISEKQTIALAKLFTAKLDRYAKDHNDMFQILDVAIQLDEAVPQVHLRKVWQSKNLDGMWEIGQNKALERAGIPLPDPSQPEGKANNRKMTFDSEIRKMYLDTCEQLGITVEREPDRAAVHNRSKQKYIADEQARTAKEQEQTARELQTEKARLEREKMALQAEREKLQTARRQIEQAQSEAEQEKQKYLKSKADLAKQYQTNREYIEIGRQQAMKNEIPSADIQQRGSEFDHLFKI